MAIGVAWMRVIRGCFDMSVPLKGATAGRSGGRRRRL
jgi:hypothetical protein